MAAQAVVEDRARLELRKSDNRRFAAVRLDVGLRGPVTTLAPGAFGRLFPGSDALEMRILVKLGPNVGVARAAHITAHEGRTRVRREGSCRLLAETRKPGGKKEDGSSGSPGYHAHSTIEYGDTPDRCTKT